MHRRGRWCSGCATTRWCRALPAKRPRARDAMSRETAILPLLRGYGPDRPVGWHRGEPIAAARFCAAAADLAAQLAPGRHVLNLCEDRLSFMLGFVAAAIAGRTSLLPPSRAAGAIREVFAAYPDTCCLADHNELPSGLPAMIVPPWPAHGRSCEAPHIAADHLATTV